MNALWAMEPQPGQLRSHGIALPVEAEMAHSPMTRNPAPHWNIQPFCMVFAAVGLGMEPRPWGARLGQSSTVEPHPSLSSDNFFRDTVSRQTLNTHNAPEGALKFPSPSALASECRNHRCVPPHLALSSLFMMTRDLLRVSSTV